ncbi:snoRNA-binding rRNA-processing protein UTP6 [Aspergillus puulaauensis]|uniref:U3 snoRNP protein n=1 Tax=Aspergillus puulaauensis TaxID=1220207 RepID=A0A7R8AK89_9EURO|nr:U3 snoRNP protein [Aspergillus puulaauensis]BCS22584.1 U3 snoRNP protein [Aspergillus puulaauensis]
MSATTDKARFFLEKSVPELKEYEKKKIFTKDEITSIIKKRSDFEHKINARGTQPADFVRYAEYEMNLDSLRRKRIKRLGIKSTGFSGQRRIFFVLDRATRKFHGDIGLWIQYIEYARQQKAYKKLSTILMDALRMHPTNADLWIYAAQYSMQDHADMSQARTYMQRGLRFCKSSRKLWIQYAKLELIYITKLVARQRILGLDEKIEAPKQQESADDLDADMIMMPKITEEDINPSASDDTVNEAALQTLNSTPALSGAIPMAIFDSAIKAFDYDDRFGHEFFDVVFEFEDIPCLQKVLSHILDVMQESKPASPHTLICYIKLPTAGIQPTSAQFPGALGTVLSRLQEHREKPRVAKEVVSWLHPIEKTKDLDPAIQTVIAATIHKAELVLQEA